MKSETDSTEHHIYVDRGRSPVTEPPSDVVHDSSHDRASESEDQPFDDSTRLPQTEFLFAMKEDLSDWLGALYGVDIGAEAFWEKLETGVLLCRHANAVYDRLCHRRTQTDHSTAHNTDDSSEQTSGEVADAEMRVSGRRQSKHLLSYHSAARPGTFQARDNISQFIGWARATLAVPDTLLFETEDLVSRRNERNILLCLLEVARRGSTQCGMPAPTLVHFEQQIDAELLQAGDSATATAAAVDCRGVADGQEDGTQLESTATNDVSRKPVVEVDWMSLDEMVRAILSECTCSVQFPMIRVAEGKYCIGEPQTLVFLRVLRNHVMVRIGGGWDTLESYLDRHDPCRCNSKQHRGTQAFAPAATTLPFSSQLSESRQLDKTTDEVASFLCCTENNSAANLEVSPKTGANNSVTAYSDVTSRTASIGMPNAAGAGSAKRSSALRKPIVYHQSTPNIATASQAAVKSRRPSSPSSTGDRTRSASRGRPSMAAAETKESTPTVTSRDTSRTTGVPVRRPPMPSPTPSPWTRSSPRSPRRANLQSRVARTSSVSSRNAAAQARRLFISPPSPSKRLSPRSPRRANSSPRATHDSTVTSQAAHVSTLTSPRKTVAQSRSASTPPHSSSTRLSPQSPRTANSSPRDPDTSNVTSHNARTTVAPVQRPSMPSPSPSTRWSPRSPRRADSPPTDANTSPRLTTSKNMSRSTNDIASTSSVLLSPPPRRTSVSSNRGAAPFKSSSVVAGRPLQHGVTNSKPVVISGRGGRAKTTTAAAAAATPAMSTHDGGAQNASMRSRVGIAPSLLLPSCYQPGKTTPRTPVRSFSVDATFTTSPPGAATTSPRIHRSNSVLERQAAPSLPATTAFDEYPEPPPENSELNSRMEMLFEEYRKVERGFIFSDEQSDCPHNSTSFNNCSPTMSPKSSTEGGSQTATAAGKRVVSMRATSVGNLVRSSSSTSLVSSRPRRNDQIVNKTSPSPSSSALSVSRAPTPTSSRTSTRTNVRGQSSPAIGRRFFSQPATPPSPRKNAVVASSWQQTGRVAKAPVAVVPSPSSSGIRSARYCGGSGVTQTRTCPDSVPALLHDASRRLREVSAVSTVAADNSARVATTQPPKRRASTPTCSVTAGQLAAPRSAEQVRVMNNRISACIKRKTTSDVSRPQTTATVFNNNSRVSAKRTQSAVDNGVRRHSTVELATHQLRSTERQSRPSTVGVRSLIPRPVSCSGRRPASLRHEDRDPPRTRQRNEPALRRFDSGVDVAAAGLSPSDDGVGGASLEATVQQLSASLESCTMVVLPDNNSTSQAWQNNSNTVDYVNDIDDEYY